MQTLQILLTFYLGGSTVVFLFWLHSNQMLKEEEKSFYKTAVVMWPAMAVGMFVLNMYEKYKEIVWKRR